MFNIPARKKEVGYANKTSFLLAMSELKNLSARSSSRFVSGGTSIRWRQRSQTKSISLMQRRQLRGGKKKQCVNTNAPRRAKETRHILQFRPAARREIGLEVRHAVIIPFAAGTFVNPQGLLPLFGVVKQLIEHQIHVQIIKNKGKSLILSKGSSQINTKRNPF